VKRVRPAGWQAVSEGKLVAKKEGRFFLISKKYAVFFGATPPGEHQAINGIIALSWMACFFVPFKFFV